MIPESLNILKVLLMIMFFLKYLCPVLWKIKWKKEILNGLFFYNRLQKRIIQTVWLKWWFVHGFKNNTSNHSLPSILKSLHQLIIIVYPIYFWCVSNLITNSSWTYFLNSEIQKIVTNFLAMKISGHQWHNKIEETNS